MATVYLDYNATTPLAPEVLAEMTAALTEAWGNPSSGYQSGRRAKQVLEAARKKVADMIGAKPEEITFTSGGTEANNMVIMGVVEYYQSWCSDQTTAPSCERPHVVITNVEHDATVLPVRHLQEQGKIDATLVPVSSQGVVTAQEVIEQLRPSTCLVSIMLANNETGVIMPVAEIARLLETENKRRAKENLVKVLLHTDAAQAIGKIGVNVEDLAVDYLTIVGHKFYGPRGGCLFARDGAPVFPLQFGGGQERGLRPGTENVAVAAGLGSAAQLVSSSLGKISRHLQASREELELALKKEFGDKDVVIHFRSPGLEVLPNTCSVSLRGAGLQGCAVLRGCERLEASVGAACHASNKPSGILLASGVPLELASNTIRLSVGRETSLEDIVAAVQDLKQSVDKIRAEVSNNK